MATVSKNPVLHQIVSGEAPEDLVDMLIARTLPFTEEEYLEALVYAGGYKGVREHALGLLKDIAETVKNSYVKRKEFDKQVFYYILQEALKYKTETVVGTIILNQCTPVEYLIKIAQVGTTRHLELLLENQIKLIAFPGILDEMEANASSNGFIKGKISEVRNFYLQDSDLHNIEPDEVIEDVVATIQEEGKVEEKSEATPDPSTPTTEEAEDEAMTLLQKINSLNTSGRIKLALTGTKTDRMILVRDANKMVALAVVSSPKISEDEVLMIIKNKSTPGEVISNIASNREFCKNYSIMLELVNNPKTPVREALGYIKKLHLRDLKQVCRDKNVSPVVRQLATNFVRQKDGIKR